MNITQLKYVLEIAGASSMREAAAKLYVTQPALSASIRELEEELGILIFERTNKGISLTGAGREFLVYVKKAVGQYEILEDRYLSKDMDKEHFSVSTQHYNFAIKAFTEVIKQLNPDKYVFSIHETKTREVLEDVRNLKSEVGIVSFSGTTEAVIIKLFREYQLEFTPLMRKEAAIKKDREDGIRFSGGQITVTELAERYIDLKQGVRYNTKVGYRYVLNLLKKEEFSGLSVESGWMTGTLLGQLKIVIWLRTAGAGSTAVSCTGFYDWYITFGKSIF